MNKGIFSYLSYRGSGANLKEAELEGMVIGIPLYLENKMQVAKAAITLDTDTDKVQVSGNFNNNKFVEGDKLHNINVYVRKSTERATELHDITSQLDAQAIDYGNYGISDVMLEDDAYAFRKTRIVEDDADHDVRFTSTAAGEPLVAPCTATTSGLVTTFPSIVTPPSTPPVGFDDVVIGDIITAVWDTTKTAIFKVTGITALTHTLVGLFISGDTPGASEALDTITVTHYLTYVTKVGDVYTFNNMSSLLGVALDLSEILAGDTLKISWNDSTVKSAYFLVTDVSLTANIITCSKVSGETVTNAMVIDEGLEVYYDYTGVSVGLEANRAFFLGVDLTVYRTSIKGQYLVSDPGEDLYTKFGTATCKNPLSNLAMGAYLFGAGGSFTQKYRFCALDLTVNTPDYQSMTPNDFLTDATLWTLAIEDIKPLMNAYYMVPLTQDTTILSMVDTYNQLSSAAQKKRPKIMYASKPIINKGVLSTEIEETFGNGLYGQTEIDNDRFYIDKDHDIDLLKSDSLALAGTIPAGYDSERVILIGTEYVTVGGVTIDGPLICALVAGYRASLPLSYSMTNQKLPMIDSVKNAGFYLDEEIDALAGAGWFMITQDMIGSDNYVYLGKTTAQENISKQLEYLPMLHDHICKTINRTLKPLEGKGLDNMVSPDRPLSAKNINYLKRVNNYLAVVRKYYVNDLKAVADFVVLGIMPTPNTKNSTDTFTEIYDYIENDIINNYVVVA